MIENQISGIAFASSIIGMSYSEIKRYNNLITPFTVTALPFLVIILAVNFVFVQFGILPVTVRAQFLILLCCTIIWVVGLLFPQKVKQLSQNNDVNPFNIFEKYSRYRYFLSALAVVITIITFWRIQNLVAANGGWFYLGTQDFEDTMIRGPVAHIIIFGKALFIFLYLISKKSKGKIITYTALGLLGISIFSLMVKYHLLWLIMIFFFINNFNRPVKIQLKKIFSITLVLVSLFIFYFIVLSIFWNTFSFSNFRLWEFFYKTILNYTLTGPIILDKWMNFPSIKPDWTFFIFIINLLNVLFGSPYRLDTVDAVSMDFYYVGMDIYSNVGTSFGVYYLIGGIPFTIFCTLIIAIISYYLFIKGLNSNSPYMSFLCWFFLTINTLNFFAQFFTLVSFYEFPVFFFLIVIISKFYLRKYKKI